MRKLHSFLLFSLAVLSFALAPSKAKASHAAGGEIIYEWISDSTYRIYFKFYRDCTGIQEPDPAGLCISNSCSISGPGTGSFNMPKWTGPIPGGITNGDPVSAGCSQYKNKCDSPNSPIPGYREWWYYYLWTSDGKCNSWNFSVSISARNFSNNIAGGNLYVETTFDNKHFEGNSSPYFSIKPIPYVCVNQPFTYNNGAIDPDGDSLYSEMVRPLDGSCGSSTAIGWGAPPTGSPAFSLPNNPLSTNNTFNINNTTGQMTFTANQVGPSTLTCKVSEYKSQQGHPFRGLKIGHIMRDVQVQVLNCSVTAPAFNQPATAITGGGWVNNQVNGCVGQRLQFDFWFKAADTDAVLVTEDNHIFTMPNANITYANLKTDSVHGHFDWLPTSGGIKSFIVTAKDSTCKPPGIMLYYPYTIPVFIWDAVSTLPDTAVCPKETAYLDAFNGGNYVWSVLPGGGPISQLSCTNCQQPVVTATQKTTFVVTSTLTTFCKNNTDTVTVDILPGLVFQPLKDVTTCPNNSVTLDLKPSPPAGVKYLVKWNPGKYLNDSTKSAVVATPKDSLTYFITLTSTANKCKGYDTVNVGVLTGFHLDNVDTAICQNEVLQVRAGADPRYTIKWTDDSSYQGIFSATNVADPTITPFKIGVKEKFTMTLSYLDPVTNAKLCRDTEASFRIDYQPIPLVTVDKDASMCEGDTMQMNGSVSPPYPYDYTWTPGSSLTDPKILNPIFSAKQTTKLTLTATTKEAKCSSSASVNLTVFPAAFLFASNDTAICPGESAQLHVTGNGVKTFRWIPDIRISDPYSYDPMVSPPATQEYKVYAVDTNFCSDTANVLVTVHPKANIELPDSVRIYPGETYKFQPGGNCSYFSWYPPLGLNRANISNPIAQPEVNTRYFVTGITEAGCSVSDSVNVLVSSESVLDVPNAFMPGSGPNGKFKIVHLGDAILKSFEIYNRWGVKVYESADLNDGWDGTFKGEPQPIGVYVYSVEAVTPSGRKFTKQGNVTLIR